MSDPKPFTPEFVRGWRSAQEHLRQYARDLASDRVWHESNAVERAAWNLDCAPAVDPLAAAEERLGAWLVAMPLRSHNLLCEQGRYEVYLNDSPSQHAGYGATLTEAINAALDAAGRLTR